MEVRFIGLISYAAQSMQQRMPVESAATDVGAGRGPQSAVLCKSSARRLRRQTSEPHSDGCNLLQQRATARRHSEGCSRRNNNLNNGSH